jgi:hypothetical protein
MKCEFEKESLDDCVYYVEGWCNKHTKNCDLEKRSYDDMRQKYLINAKKYEKSVKM